MTMARMTTMMMMMAAFWAGAVGPAAGSAQQAPPPVCEQEDEYHAFDFWIGDWDVVVNDSTRTPAGTNSIQPLHRHCVLEEKWTTQRKMMRESQLKRSQQRSEPEKQ
jgi:hypothetical protein